MKNHSYGARNTRYKKRVLDHFSVDKEYWLLGQTTARISAVFGLSPALSQERGSQINDNQGFVVIRADY
jgi:hypothetical protein